MAETFTVPFKFKGTHSCEAVVLACIDFRFWKETMQFVEEKLGITSYDFPKLPGAAKTINESQDGDLPHKCISVPVDLHHVEKIVLINHTDCGAYGGAKVFEGDSQKEQEFHFAELKKAHDILKAKYPDKEIILALAKLSEDQESIEFLPVQ